MELASDESGLAPSIRPRLAKLALGTGRMRYWSADMRSADSLNWNEVRPGFAGPDAPVGIARDRLHRNRQYARRRLAGRRCMRNCTETPMASRAAGLNGTDPARRGWSFAAYAVFMPLSPPAFWTLTR